MWSFASKAIGGSLGLKGKCTKQNYACENCSDDEASSHTSREETLECPICWESFNIVENIPYVLWCGHTLCKNCVLGLQWAVVKFPTLPLQLPLFISCPWCHLLSFRLVYKGELKFPRKNFFLLWMVESINGDRSRSVSSLPTDARLSRASSSSSSIMPLGNEAQIQGPRRNLFPHLAQPNLSPSQINPCPNYLNIERFQDSLRKSVLFFVQLTAKFPLVVIFLLIVLYAIPASAAILALYILITVLFALPSFLVLYFAYPSLDWLIREITT
ncbi:uncharacterized protein LOC144707630 [Wolffia australiana]